MKYNFYLKKQQHETKKGRNEARATRYETNPIENVGKELYSLHNQTLKDVVTWHWTKLRNKLEE